MKFFFKPAAWLLSWALFLTGDLALRTYEQALEEEDLTKEDVWGAASWCFNIYQWCMLHSIDVQDWANNTLGPWERAECGECGCCNGDEDAS